MSEEEMLHTLEEHHLTIRAGLDEIRFQCAAPDPNSGDLDAARSRLSSASVTTWTRVTIEADWNGYRTAAALIWTIMECQIDLERRDLGDRLTP